MHLEPQGMKIMLENYLKNPCLRITMAEVFEELKAKTCKALRSIAALTVVWKLRLASILFLVSAYSAVFLGRSPRWCIW